MHVCVCECIHVWMHVCICGCARVHVWVCACVSEYVRIRVCVYLCAHVHICMCVRMCAHATFHRQHFLLGCYGNHSSKNVKLNPTPCGPEKPKERMLSDRYIWVPRAEADNHGLSENWTGTDQPEAWPQSWGPMAWIRASGLRLLISPSWPFPSFMFSNYLPSFLFPFSFLFSF